MLRKHVERYDDGFSSIWDFIPFGPLQGVKDFFQNPVKEVLCAEKGFTRADDLSSGAARSGENNGDENDSSEMANEATDLEQELDVARW